MKNKNNTQRQSSSTAGESNQINPKASPPLDEASCSASSFISVLGETERHLSIGFENGGLKLHSYDGRGGTSFLSLTEEQTNKFVDFVSNKKSGSIDIYDLSRI